MVRSARNCLNAQCPRTGGPGLFWVLILIYLVIFGYKAVTRTDEYFDPDEMNFVDVARNVVNGRGLTQSTLGFNQPRFSVDDAIPAPFTTQAPLYPLLIAFVAWIGLPFVESAALVTSACFCLGLLIAYRMCRELYDDRTARVAVLLLLPFPPLYELASSAMSGVAGLFFMLLSLWLINRARRPDVNQLQFAAMAGIATGLAFATRYALAPLVVVGVIFILRESTLRFRTVSIYVLGFLSVAGLVWIHNWSVNGTLMPHPNPSTVSLIDIIKTQIKNIREMPSNAPRHAIFFTSELVAVMILGVISFRRKMLLATIHQVFIAQGRYLLTMWAVIYLCFLIYERGTIHIDSIGSRLLLPSSAILPIFIAAFAVKTVKVEPRFEHSLVTTAAALILLFEAIALARLPIYDQSLVIAKSELLSWIEDETTGKDLIIGDDTVYVPFYFNRGAAVSFSRHPYTDYIDYSKILGFSRKHCGQYDHFYLVISAKGINKAKHPERYGPFITDLARDRAHQYSHVKLFRRLSDGLVFTIDCT